MSVLPESYTDHDLKSITQILTRAFESVAPGEMENGVSAIPNPLPPCTLVAEDEPFQIMVVGGTNFRSARARLHNGQIIIDEVQECELPLLATRKTFLSLLSAYLMDDISLLAVNFSFPLQAFLREDRLDGTIMRGSKQHTLTNLKGKTLGQEIEAYVNSTRTPPLSVTCAHDTTCLLLAAYEQTGQSPLIGGVIGTGMNFARLENERVINFESGNFSNFPATETGQKIDEESDTPGEQQYEKEVAGAFLPLHYNHFLQFRNAEFTPISTTEDLSGIAADDHHPHRDVARRLLHRSARLAACQIAGLFHAGGRDPLTFAMEGSLFWKGWNYRKTITRTLKLLDVPPSAIRWTHIEDSALYGGGRLVVASNYSSQT